MNKTIIRLTLLLIAIGTPYLSFDAQACVCMPQQSPYREYREARVVFVGKVLGSNDIDVTEKSEGKTYTTRDRIFQFSVNER